MENPLVLINLKWKIFSFIVIRNKRLEKQGNDMKKIKGAVFDFNGTLFWDTSFHNRAWDIFLENHSISLSDSEKHESLHGRTNREILLNIFYP